MSNVKRSLKQNSAIHLYCTWLSNRLNIEKIGIGKVLEYDKAWNFYDIEYLFWRPFSKAILGKEETKNISFDDIISVYNVLNFHIRQKLQIDLPAPKDKKLRDWFKYIADFLNSAGISAKEIIKNDYSWTPESVKNILWRSFQYNLLHKYSTKELTPYEVSQVYDSLNFYFSNEFEVFVRFPERRE